MIRSVGLIGVGRFGKVLANILKKGFNVKAYDIVSSKVSNDLTKSDLDEILMLDHIFIAVPIRYFETLIKDISNKVSKNSTIIDAVLVMTEKKYGCVVVLDKIKKIKGIITDGDLRRSIAKINMKEKATKIMKSKPIVAKSNLLISSAIFFLCSLISLSDILKTFLITKSIEKTLPTI